MAGSAVNSRNRRYAEDEELIPVASSAIHCMQARIWRQLNPTSLHDTRRFMLSKRSIAWPTQAQRRGQQVLTLIPVGSEGLNAVEPALLCDAFEREL